MDRAKNGTAESVVFSFSFAENADMIMAVLTVCGALRFPYPQHIKTKSFCQFGFARKNRKIPETGPANGAAHR